MGGVALRGRLMNKYMSKSRVSHNGFKDMFMPKSFVQDMLIANDLGLEIKISIIK
jgi:hypothetical protein